MIITFASEKLVFAKWGFPLNSVVHPEQYACQKANHTKDAESSGCDKEYPHGHIACKFQFYGSFCLSLACNQEHRFQYSLDCIIDGSWEQGYGRQSMNELESFLKKEGVKQISLNVFPYNTVARNLYQTSGYKEAAITMLKYL